MSCPSIVFRSKISCLYFKWHTYGVLATTWHSFCSFFPIIRIGWIIIKGKYPLTEYAVNTSFNCIILRLSFANSISNVLSNRTTLMVRSHLGVIYPKFVYCLVLPLFFLLSLFVAISRGTLMVWLATTWPFFYSILLLELSLNKNC